MKRSQTTANRVSDLYALLATAAATKAIKQIEAWSDPIKAGMWADLAVQWLDKASAKSAQYTYRQPKVTT